MRAIVADPAAAGMLVANRYRLVEIVGEGGMAVVWRAQDQLLGRTVAVKMLREQYGSDPDFLERLHSEARAAATLNDPGVVGVYDVGEAEGRHFLVMEFVPGADLKALIRAEAPLDPARAVALCAEIARAVGKAHESGMIHRDIKPQNVIVMPDGKPKVADFGIARAVAAAGTTAPGVVMGTVHYLAPESASGGPAGPASDVYSLGVVLYEMLGGRLPFEADSTMGVVMKILHDAPEALDRINPRVPAVLVGIVERAMARDPAARYPDAGAMSDALCSFARWSEQSTGRLELPPTAGLSSQGPGAPLETSVPRASRGVPRTGAPRGPVLDPIGLLLALLALAAVAGLVPLWSAVRERYQSPDGAGLLRRSAPVLLGAPAEPTVIPTVVHVTVPDVVGQDAEAARRLLEGSGLGASTEVEASTLVNEGRVIRQRPQADSVVPAETVVELVVSGQQPLVVPVLTGGWQEASQTLEAMGFVPLRREQWSGEPAGLNQVIGIDPPPGSRWPRGAPVHVTVDSGSWLALGADFESGIHLRGVDIRANRVAPGSSLGFSAIWERIAVVEEDAGSLPECVVRAALESSDGVVIARDEHVPANGSRPTSGWQPGEVVTGDAFALAVPADAPPGDYALWLDVYRQPDPADRLGVLAGAFASTEAYRVKILSVLVETPGA